ncbi:MAG: protein kinase [Myxococcota bacterium]|nr:protein kinase [Myxococcota bacterium]
MSSVTSPSDHRIARLIDEERLVEAAQLSSATGDAQLASRLYERACKWDEAAREALRAGDAMRALELAVAAGDERLTQQVAQAVSANEVTAIHAADRLAARGHHAWAARILELVGRSVDAAREWEHAGDAMRAAAALDRTGHPARATRVLEAALRRDPALSSVAIMLGALLVRYEKWETAVRVLQRVPPSSVHRREALVSLVRALDGLQLSQAAREAEAELASLGGRATPDVRGAVLPSGAPVPARLYGRYDVLREVASSATARVLECLDVARGERVAVKLLSVSDTPGPARDALARFERETRVLRALEHPQVVPVCDFLLEPPALVLAWMGGGTLEKMLAPGQPLAPARAIEIAESLLSALGAAHRVGILHRDVKPANVLFNDAGAALLSDFGVAHVADISATATAGNFGARAYMSPELRAGHAASVGSDLFAVGLVLREMLTGEPPLEERLPSCRPSEAHRGLDARHDAAIARMTASDPAHRPADANDARALLHGSGGERISWPVAAEPSPQRSRGWSVPLSRPSLARVAVAGDGALVDTWAGRPIERFSLTERALVMARAFASADDSGLQTVLRVDREDDTIWLELITGRVLDRALSSAEHELLRGTLRALHDAGAVHGNIDRAHIVLQGVCGPRPILRFAAADAPADAFECDFLALAQL